MSRYIDADALIKKYQEQHDFFLSAWGGDFKSMGMSDKARCDELTNCIATMVNAPSIDICFCRECKYRERCEQIVVFDIGENQVEGRKIDFCSYGDKRDD